MKHFHEKIEGWCNFEELIRLLVATLPANNACWIEVGSWKGRSAAFTGVEMINQGKKGILHCIDTWKGSEEEAHKEDPDILAGALQERCRENLSPLGDMVCFTVVDSVSASIMFPDCGADVVFLDAAHDYENVKADLNAWADKVKPGGYLAGDDMEWQGVRTAVLEFFETRKDYTLSLHIPPSGYAAWVARKEKSPEKPG